MDKQQDLDSLVDRIRFVVTDLNNLTSSIVNQEVTAADFQGDLSQLFTKLSEVEVAVSELEDVFWQTAESPEEKTNALRMDTP